MEPVARCGSRECREMVKIVELELQLIGASLRSIADEMGATLVRSAFSANIKERRDCSTAPFDRRGRMIAQAEHIPVHLGARPDAEATVLAHLVARMADPDGRGGDLRGQLAAHRLAELRLAGRCERWGSDRVEAAMAGLHEHSDRRMRRAIARLPNGRFEATDVLEP